MARSRPTTSLASVIPIAWQVPATTFLLGFVLANGPLSAGTPSGRTGRGHLETQRDGSR
jgi:hypothetical protein